MCTSCFEASAPSAMVCARAGPLDSTTSTHKLNLAERRLTHWRVNRPHSRVLLLDAHQLCLTLAVCPADHPHHLHLFCEFVS